MDKSDRQERAADRKQRLAQQLRDNLKKRKQQARARNSSSSKDEDHKTARSDGFDKSPARGAQNKDDV